MKYYAGADACVCVCAKKKTVDTPMRDYISIFIQRKYFHILYFTFLTDFWLKGFYYFSAETDDGFMGCEGGTFSI